MIDGANRTAVAELLRHYLAGLITNDELQDRLPVVSGDPGVREVAAASWYLYDELRAYRLAGKDKAPPATRAVVARWILFLGTDLEYEYPIRSWAWRLAFTAGNLLSLGLTGRVWRWRNREREERWPFFRQSDLENALQSPKLLAGRA